MQAYGLSLFLFETPWWSNPAVITLVKGSFILEVKSVHIRCGDRNYNVKQFKILISILNEKI